MSVHPRFFVDDDELDEMLAQLRANISDDFNEELHPRDRDGRWTIGNHPAGPHKQEVRGTSAERVAGRRLLETKTDPIKIHAVKLRAIASFWKQHAALVRQGKMDKAAELAEKIGRYAAKYRIPNPLGGGAPRRAATPSAPQTSLEQKKSKIMEDLPKMAEVGRSFRPGSGGTHAVVQKLVDTLASRDITAEQFVKGMLPIPTTGKPQLTTSEWSANKLSVAANLPSGGSITRYLNFDSGTVEHAFFRVGRSNTTGEGIGKDVLRSQIALYEKLGMKKVEVGANIDVGGYAWAKYGFVPHTHEWRSIMRSSLSRAVDRDLTPSYTDHKGHTITTTDEDKSGLKKLIQSDDPKAFWAIADSKHGKKLLLGTSWHGTLDLRDEPTMRRFKAYVNRGHA